MCTSNNPTKVKRQKTIKTRKKKDPQVHPCRKKDCSCEMVHNFTNSLQYITLTQIIKDAANELNSNLVPAL